MKKISAKEFIQILIATTVDEIGLTTETTVKLNKRGNPLADKNVTKVTVGTFQFGGSFSERLTEALDASLGVAPGTTGKVETKSLPWGKWYEGAENKVIEHEKKDGSIHYYLRYYNAVDELTVDYKVDGNAPTEEDLKNIDLFSPAKKKTTSYITENCGEVENKTLKTNVVDFENILKVTVDGEDYEIE